MKNREDLFGAVSVAVLLLLTAWGNDWAMFIVAAVANAPNQYMGDVARVQARLLKVRIPSE